MLDKEKSAIEELDKIKKKRRLTDGEKLNEYYHAGMIAGLNFLLHNK